MSAGTDAEDPDAEIDPGSQWRHRPVCVARFLRHPDILKHTEYLQVPPEGKREDDYDSDECEDAAEVNIVFGALPDVLSDLGALPVLLPRCMAVFTGMERWPWAAPSAALDQPRAFRVAMLVAVRLSILDMMLNESPVDPEGCPSYRAAIGEYMNAHVPLAAYIHANSEGAGSLHATDAELQRTGMLLKLCPAVGTERYEPWNVWNCPNITPFLPFVAHGRGAPPDPSADLRRDGRRGALGNSGRATAIDMPVAFAPRMSPFNSPTGVETARLLRLYGHKDRLRIQTANNGGLPADDLAENDPDVPQNLFGVGNVHGAAHMAVTPHGPRQRPGARARQRSGTIVVSRSTKMRSATAATVAGWHCAILCARLHVPGVAASMTSTDAVAVPTAMASPAGL